MPPIYDVTDHPLLSDKAQALEGYPAELDAHVMVAETILGLVGTAYTDDLGERATAAVARQVNLQVEVGVPALKAKTQGARSWTYLDTPIDPVAQAMVALLADEYQVLNEPSTGAFPPVTSFR
jgi:hypothetical protein